MIFKAKNNQQGYTLIEMMIAISIFVILMSAVTLFFVVLYRQQAGDIARIERQNIASQAMEKIGKEIRKMNRAENGTFALSLAGPQDVIFYSDADNDGLTEKMEYILNGTDLERKLIEPGALLDYSGAAVTAVAASGVRNGANPVFKYYDENYTGSQSPLSSPVNVTMVKVVGIELDINVDESHLTSPLHVETKIYPRNLKSFN